MSTLSILRLYHFDYQYLNGAKTAPPTALTSATLTFTMPTAPGSYNFSGC